MVSDLATRATVVYLGRAMIRLDSVGRQHGQQILFTDASAAVNRGEKVGLVGPNGSGKTTIFRMILKEETPDTGSVTVDRGTTIGYFSQDVGEMSGHTVVAMAMAGAGQVADVAQELRELEAAFGDPEKADQMDELVNRYGDRISDVGSNGAPDIIEQGRPQVDLVLSQKFGRFNVRIGGDNLLDSRYNFTQGVGNTQERERSFVLGRTFSLSVGVNVF